MSKISGKHAQDGGAADDDHCHVALGSGDDGLPQRIRP